MNLKSLLLGSAAAFATVTGAQAADAIMAAAPEPVNYVRVCDAFGTGYFYIPGTETCLKIGGYVRQDIGGGDLLGGNNGLDTDGDGKGDAYYTHTRFSLQTDTKSDTELGVLHTFTETRFNYTNGTQEWNSLDNAGGTNTTLNFAYIELGGFRVGKTESEFTRMSFYGHGYAGAVIDDTLIGYGPKDATQISYTYKAPNGLAAVIAVEDDNGGSNDRGDFIGTAVDLNGIPYNRYANSNDYIPDVIAGVSYDNGTFGIAAVGAYDSSLEEGAVKLRADAKLGRFTAFLMGAYSTNGDETGQHGCTGLASILSCGSNHYAIWGGDWAIYGGVSAALTEKVAANVQLSYDDDEDFAAAGNLVFHVVPGFDVTTEIDYADSGSGPRFDRAAGQSYAFGDRGRLIDQEWGGVVRFQRTF
ncbi:MAG: porin [Pararhizobium sp.]